MHVFRGVLALSLCVSFCAYNLPLYAGGKPLGILTMAYGAHLNASAAFAGVSVFDGESVSTEPEGKLSMRIGGSVITLAEQSAATLQRSGDGAHVDLDAGAVYLWSAESNPLEGQTYRIYLETEEDPRGTPGAADDAQKAGITTATKVAYFIVAGSSAGVAAWGIHDLIQSSRGVESPAKP